MATSAERNQVTTANALQEWREAERTVAVARRGRVAAQAAAVAAQEASEAAVATAAAAAATAKAAQAALDAAALGEASAARMAVAARVVVQATGSDVADSETDVGLSEVAESEAHYRYNLAADAAAERRRPGESN